MGGRHSVDLQGFFLPASRAQMHAGQRVGGENSPSLRFFLPVSRAHMHAGQRVGGENSQSLRVDQRMEIQVSNWLSLVEKINTHSVQKKQIILGFKIYSKKQVILSYLESTCACKNQLLSNIGNK